MKPIYLVVPHCQRNETGVLDDSLHNLMEVLLELIVGQVNFKQVVIVLKQKLTDDSG